MLNGIINKNNSKIILINFIIYSFTILWLVVYDFLNYYLHLNNANVRNDISIGISIKILSLFILIISLVIHNIKQKKIKVLIIILYFCFSSYLLLPQNPYKWLFFSFGTIVYFYFLDIFISLLSLKNNKEIIIVCFAFISIFLSLFIILSFFLPQLINSYLLLLFKYYFIGYLLITVVFIVLSKIKKLLKKNKI